MKQNLGIKDFACLEKIGRTKMHERILRFTLPDYREPYRKLMWNGDFQDKACLVNFDGYNASLLKDFGYSVKKDWKIAHMGFIQYLIKHNSENGNKFQYTLDLGFRTYPDKDTGVTELKNIITSFSEVPGFDNLKWRFANGMDLYGHDEQQRVEWFLDTTSLIKKENIIMDLCNYDMVDLYKSAMPEAQINYYNIYFSRMMLSNMLTQKLYTQTSSIKERHAICLNRTIKTHREKIVNLCKQHVDKVYYTRGGGWKHYKDEEWQPISGGITLEDTPISVEHPMSVDRTKHAHQDSPDYDKMKNAYTYICTETFFEQYSSEQIKYAYITEKSLKSAFFEIPMIICGLPKSLSTWKRLGFYSFPEFFDESYDDEYNDEKRYEMVEAEIKKIFSMTKQQLHDLYWSDGVQQKLAHNKKQFFKHFFTDPSFKFHRFNYTPGINVLMDQAMELYNE